MLNIFRGFLNSTRKGFARMSNTISTVVAFAIGFTIWGAAIIYVIPTSILAAAIGFTAFLFVVPAVPGFIELLINKPNRNQVGSTPIDKTIPDFPKSQFGFFTFLQPGRVKIIERGNRFIRAVMRLEHHMFNGEQENDLTPRHQEYWEVVKTPPEYTDSGPIPPHPWTKYGQFDWLVWITYSPISLLFWIWKRWVYKKTGAVFTGIYPFQRVRIYPLEHFKRITGEKGEVSLQRILDYSDHYRVADFQYPLQVPHVHTKDKVPVKVLVNVVARVYNPYMTAYNTDDDWGSRLTASINDAITTFVRPRPIDDVLSTEPGDVHKLAQTIEKIGVYKTKKGAVCEFGLIIRLAQILDVSPSPMTDEERKLADLAFARIDKASREERAKGDAALIRETGRALEEHPNASLVLQIDGMVRAAEAAGKQGNLVLLPVGSSFSPDQAALLHELRGIRKGGT